MNVEKRIVWPAIDPKTAGVWLWTSRKDFFWIIGGGSLLFAALAVPITLAVPKASDLLVVAFLHAGALCNYPHYAVTYRLIVDERARARSSYLWLLASTPVALFLLVFGVLAPWAISPLVRVYLTWSAYHYAAQHFGIASMYQAREKAPLAPREKRALQVGFVSVALHLMLLINTYKGLGSENVFGAATIARGAMTLLPSNAYPFAVAAAVVGVASFALAESWHKQRTGHGLKTSARLLFLTNFVWFVVPFIHLPGRNGPWGGLAIAAWVTFALPFFHCAQYLAVCGWRARMSGPMKPVFYYMGLVFLGLALFEGIAWLMPRVSHATEVQTLMLVPAVLNIHHFFLDGLMWKSKRAAKPSAAQPTEGPADLPKVA
mgnify:CR=1 FL=1